MTVGDALRDATGHLGNPGSDSSHQEARWLLGHLLQKSPSWLTVHTDHELEPDLVDRLRSMTLRRLRGEPLSYVLEEAEFFGRRFYVDNRVLVPRPETEELIERAIGFARGMLPSIASRLRIVDVGTGSGVGAISLAVELDNDNVVGVDISKAALEVARINVRRHRVQHQVTLTRSDLLSNIPGPIDLLVANLPYVRSGLIPELQPEVLREPRLALDGGPDGFALYRRLFKQARNHLSSVGGMFVEIADDHGSIAIAEAGQWFPDRSVEIFTDLAGRDRFVAVTTRTGPSA